MWSWSRALLGAAYAAPSAVLTAVDPGRGLALTIGVLCAAGLGLRPTRRGRALAVVAGLFAGAGIFLGSCVAPWPVLAVATVTCAATTIAALAPRHRLGPLVLTLSLPLSGAGLSLSGPTDGAAAGALVVTGSVYAWLVSLCWPQHSPPEGTSTARSGASPVPQAPSRRAFAIALGFTAGATATIGYLLGFDHPGWACTAALMVSRPSPDLTRLRVWGRACAVTTGATAALLLAATHPPSGAIAVCAVAVIAMMAATAGSRWYLTGGFSTFIVLSLLMVEHPAQTEWWFAERVAATLIGVGTAALVVGTTVQRGAPAVGTGAEGRRSD